MTVKEFIYYTFKYGIVEAFEVDKLKYRYNKMSEGFKEKRGWQTIDKFLDAKLGPIRYGMIISGIMFFLSCLSCIGSIFLISWCKNDVEYAILLFVILYLASVYFYKRLYCYEMPKEDIRRNSTHRIFNN